MINEDLQHIGFCKAYHPNGKLAIECNYSLFGSKDLLIYMGAVKIDYVSIEVKEYSILEALKHKENEFFLLLDGLCKIYDKQGKLIRENNFKNDGYVEY